MAVTQVGVVYYADDPANPFRWVYPTSDDAELDDPQWTAMGCDPARVAVLLKVAAGDPAARLDLLASIAPLLPPA